MLYRPSASVDGTVQVPWQSAVSVLCASPRQSPPSLLYDIWPAMGVAAVKSSPLLGVLAM